MSLGVAVCGTMPSGLAVTNLNPVTMGELPGRGQLL